VKTRKVLAAARTARDVFSRSGALVHIAEFVGRWTGCGLRVLATATPTEIARRDLCQRCVMWRAREWGIGETKEMRVPSGKGKIYDRGQGRENVPTRKRE
jgi:hypothetical protein